MVPMSDAWTGFSWVNDPVEGGVASDGTLRWATRPQSDFWHHTGGVAGADDGDAFLVPVEGDFRATMSLRLQAGDQYDQCGVMVRADARHWVKAGIEVDGERWLSVVETRGTSDWSRQRWSSDEVDLVVSRDGDTLAVAAVMGTDVVHVRQLVLDGPVLVGPYSCAPKGDGFPVVVNLDARDSGSLAFRAQAG